jgi:hypothetical protein
VHAWVLMSNHYHWVLETPEANLVELFVSPTEIIQKFMGSREVNMKRKLPMAPPCDVNNLGDRTNFAC